MALVVEEPVDALVVVAMAPADVALVAEAGRAEMLVVRRAVDAVATAGWATLVVVAWEWAAAEALARRLCAAEEPLCGSRVERERTGAGRLG